MGSSNKKKKEKKKDFQVSATAGAFYSSSPYEISLTISSESQAKSRQSQGQGRQLHRHQLQVQVHCRQPTSPCPLPQRHRAVQVISLSCCHIQSRHPAPRCPRLSHKQPRLQPRWHVKPAHQTSPPHNRFLRISPHSSARPLPRPPAGRGEATCGEDPHVCPRRHDTSLQ